MRSFVGGRLGMGKGRERVKDDRDRETEKKEKQEKFCWPLTPSEEHQEREIGSGQSLFKRGCLSMHRES